MRYIDWLYKKGRRHEEEGVIYTAEPDVDNLHGTAGGLCRG